MVKNGLDGTKLVGWLEARGYLLNEDALGYHARLVRDWRKGTNPTIFEADKVLTKLDLHLDMLPMDFWVHVAPPPSPNRNGRYFPDDVKAAAVSRIRDDGESIGSVARSLGCHRRSVSKWLQKVAA